MILCPNVDQNESAPEFELQIVYVVACRTFFQKGQHYRYTSGHNKRNWSLGTNTLALCLIELLNLVM